jgi:hypothetical protein
MGEVREGRATASFLYKGKLPSLELGLAFQVRVEQVPHRNSSTQQRRRVLQGFLANPAVIDAFIGINALGPLGAHTLRPTSASTFARFSCAIVIPRSS